MSAPNAAERYAALTALKAGLDAQIAKAKADTLTEAAAGSVKAWDTPYGPVNVTRDAPGVAIDGPAFLAWCQENRPDEVVMTPTVRSSFIEAMSRRLVAIRTAGVVIDQDSGEVIPWAYVTAQGDPTVSYPATAQQKDTKAWARALFEDRAEALTSGLRELTGGAL